MNKPLSWIVSRIKSHIEAYEYDDAADGFDALAMLCPESAFASDARRQARDLRSWGPFALRSALSLMLTVENTHTI